MKHILQTLTTIVLLLLLTTAIYLYTSGYRLEKTNSQVAVDLRRTGLISAKSIPEGANVYINGVLKTATNDTVSSLDPGIYTLKIVKNGFVTWEKDVEVFSELVTDITAVLVSQTPRLEPLTNTGARVPTVSPTLTKLAYFSKDTTKPGIWIIPLGGTALSLFRSQPYIAIEDTSSLLYSDGESIEWSPDENELLITLPNQRYYLLDLANTTTRYVTVPQEIREDWARETLEKRQDFLQELRIPEDIYAQAINITSTWSPDQKKFLYTVEKDSMIEYRVHNMEKPLPIGEKIDNLVFTTNKDQAQPKIAWYADSFHLILTEGDVTQNNRGTLSLIRIDGTNKTEIYNNTLFSPNAYSTPSGDKIIVLTSFKSSGQTDLYTIGIR